MDAGVEVADRLFCVEDEAAKSAKRADSIIDSVGNFKKVYHNSVKACAIIPTGHTRMTNVQSMISFSTSQLHL